MATGLQSWSVKESGSPVSSAEILTANGTTTKTFSSTTRALMGVTASSVAGTMTITLGGGGTLVLPNQAAIDAVFAPGGIVPFACTSFVFSNAGETAFQVVGLF
jgi:hypothetical protein|tara:strand:+ start:334 stop:645 length:312 start_codon:yes stop_codon:yes gene_type:complete